MSIDYEPGFDPATDPGEPSLPAESGRGNGLVTVPRDRGMAPALLAEQQRAKSEIEAALTIAAARPRDQKEAVDRICTACQRPGLAANAQYSYSRGGSDITGPSIRLLEIIAQNWGNVEWGFRELARFPASGGRPGESVVEAFAWDLETNSRVRRQFTVEHAMKAHGKVKQLTDPRDIYEYIANTAQRRVRTCLENIIPRDIQETACEECDKTVKASIKDVAKAAADMLKAFLSLGVTRDMVESRIQRRIDAITPAQIIGLRKVYASIRDGMSEAADWFDEPEADATPKSAAEQAKAALRKRAGKQAEEPAPEPEPTHDSADPIASTIRDIANCGMSDLQSVRDGVEANQDISESDRTKVLDAITAREKKLKAEKNGGQLFNQGK